MSYNFTFDLSKVSQALFRDITEFAQKERVHEKIGHIARTLAEKFNVAKLIGLPVNDSITIIEDLIDVQTRNNISKDHFQKTSKRAVFLPHCSRKYMDNRCQAAFDTETSSYQCKHCSEDCMIHQATQLALQENYDVYILPGASCVRNILRKKHYDGVVGVACTDELRIGLKILENIHTPAQAIPLIKNGCSATRFNFELYKKTIQSHLA
jgi:hypothetical protein